MHPNTAAFLRTLQLNEVPLDALPSWVGDLAIGCVEEANLDEVLAILSAGGSAAHTTFWEQVDHAPHTQVGWEKLVLVGAELTDKDAALQKSKLQRTVAVCRAYRSRVSIGREL